MIKKNIDITNLTTLRIPSIAKYYAQAKSAKKIINALDFAKKNNLDYCVIGNGSKILFKNKTYNGIIIHNLTNFIKYKNNILQVASGVKLSVLANFCLKKLITGFEWLGDIPGTVGGAVFMNAGAFESDISDILVKVTALDTRSNKIKIYLKKDIKFNHRYSSFQDKKKHEIILEASFNALKAKKREIIKKMHEYRKYRAQTQPIGKYTLGSTFKNPEKASAGFLLDKAGCRGMRVGHAEISKKHANFIINKQKASSRDILKLISQVKKIVNKKFGINLELEIILK